MKLAILATKRRVAHTWKKGITMRRLLALGLALAMLSGAVGCRHMVGICDCDRTCHCDPYGLAVMRPTIIKTEAVEPIKVKPMEEEKKPMEEEK